MKGRAECLAGLYPDLTWQSGAGGSSMGCRIKCDMLNTTLTLLVASLFIGSSAVVHAQAVYKCIGSNGQPTYQESPCKTASAKNAEYFFSPAPTPLPTPKAAPAAGVAPQAAPAVTSPKGFTKNPKSPTFRFVYNPTNAPQQFPVAAVESAIISAVNAWNAGCNVNIVYNGTSTKAVQLTQLPTEGSVVRWERLGPAVAGLASPTFGLALTTDTSLLNKQSHLAAVVMHEMGHTLGIMEHLHTGSTMQAGPSSGSPTPTSVDFAACNEEMAKRYGVGG
jgi:hypothetical protein